MHLPHLQRPKWPVLCMAPTAQAWLLHILAAVWENQGTPPPSLSFLICRMGRLPATARRREPGVQARGSLAERVRGAALGLLPPSQPAAAGVEADISTG